VTTEARDGVEKGVVSRPPALLRRRCFEARMKRTTKSDIAPTPSTLPTTDAATIWVLVVGVEEGLAGTRRVGVAESVGPCIDGPSEVGEPAE
jgi:hypothetical protein